MEFNFPYVKKFSLLILSGIVLLTVSTFLGNAYGNEREVIQGIRRPGSFRNVQVPTIPSLSSRRSTLNYLRGDHLSTVKPSRTRESRENDDEEGTLNLIRQADYKIDLRPTHRDLVLMLGNTGAGKTTISKFLTMENDLESYWDSRGRFLIRDKENKIGSVSTVISKTIFPELFIEEETGTAFYDLPGFSDTRNSSIELANAYFIKKVADHARRVKLVFIVNHSSLLPGENRIDFMTLVRHVISFIPDTKKFEEGIVLIASKVDSSMPSDRIISGIAGFLNQVIIDLPEVIEEDQLENAINFVSAMTMKSEDGTEFPRIGLFGFIDKGGPLSGMPRVQTAKELLEEIIYDNTEYVSKSVHDFRVPVSSETVLLSRSLISIINKRIENSTSELHQLIVNLHITSDSSIVSESCNKWISVTKDIDIVQTTTSALSECQDIDEFLIVLNQTLRFLGIDGHNLFKEYERNLGNIQFFQAISDSSRMQTQTGTFKPIQWLSPLKFTQSFLNQESQKAIQDLNEDICNSTHAVGKEYSKLIIKKLKIANVDLPKLQIELESDLKNFHSIKQLILVKRTSRPKEFSSETMKLMENMSVTFASGFLSSQFIHICKDLREEDQLMSTLASQSIFFTPMLWVAPFERFGPFLNQEIRSLSIKIINNQHSQTIASQNKTIESLENGIQRLSFESLMNMTALRKSQEESFQNNTRHLNQVKQNALEIETNRTIEMNKLAKERENDREKWENQVKETEKALKAKQKADKIAFEKQRDLDLRNAAKQREEDLRAFERRANNLKEAMEKKAREANDRIIELLYRQTTRVESSRKERCFITNCHAHHAGSGCPDGMKTRNWHHCWGIFGKYEECCTS